MEDGLSTRKNHRVARALLISLLISVAAVLAMSCVIVVTGSGNVVTEERNVSDFERVSLSGVGNS